MVISRNLHCGFDSVQIQRGENGLNLQPRETREKDKMQGIDLAQSQGWVEWE
jgi:hypothetical protein